MKLFRFRRWRLLCTVVCLSFLSLCPVTTTADPIGVPRPDHVVIVMEENKGFDKVYLSPDAPYINELASQGALFVSSYAVTHPSQPNYLALFSGSTQGITDDSCPHSFNGPNLANSLLDAGFTFAGYSESLPAAGSGTCESGAYARKHNPWVNFGNVPRAANLPFTRFPAAFNQLPDLCFVVPNQNNDMHDGTIATGDAWLRQHIAAYAQWAMANNSLLILTQDEGPNGGDNRVITLLVGPMVRPGQYSEPINHYTLLRTLLAMYGLAPIGHAADKTAITNCWTPESVNPPVAVSLSSPIDGSILQAPVDITLTAGVTSLGGFVGKVEFFAGTTKIGVVTDRPFQFTLTNAVPGAYSFKAKATDNLGRTAISTAVGVRVLPLDTIAPTVKIASPRQNSRLSNEVVTIQGTASDAGGVARVEYRVGDGTIQNASGTTNWSARVELTPGTNLVWAQSVDRQGNGSTPSTLKLIYVVTGILTVDISGGGIVTPDLNGKPLAIGQRYSVTAQPATGYLFAGWTGGITSEAARLVFPMESNLLIRARFVTNPFIPATGAYFGLFHDTNDVRPESSGFVRLTLASNGSLSGDLQSAGHRYPWRGQFDLSGHAAVNLARPGDSPLSMELSLVRDGGIDQIRGAVTDGDWVSTLLTDRAVFNASTDAAPFSGQYTMAIPADPPGNGGPPGYGFGTIRVSSSGAVQFTGLLADGTRITEVGPLSRDGAWPCYVSLYGGKGFILGRLRFTDGIAGDVNGEVYWMRPTLAGAGIDLPGFTNASFAIGSSYRPPPAMSRVLNLTNGVIEFSGEAAGVGFTNDVVLGPDNRLTNLSSNRLSVTINAATGTWRGTVTEPATGLNLLVQGVLLQHENVGLGFFVTAQHGGQAVLRAR